MAREVHRSPWCFLGTTRNNLRIICSTDPVSAEGPTVAISNLGVELSVVCSIRISA